MLRGNWFVLNVPQMNTSVSALSEGRVEDYSFASVEICVAQVSTRVTVMIRWLQLDIV